MNPYFSLSDKVYDIIERYPQLLDLLASNGFENLRNATLRNTLGRTISMETAIKSKRYDPTVFEQKMVDVIEQNRSQVSTGLADTKHAVSDVELRLAGVLPCPIRLQLLETLDTWLTGHNIKIAYELQAASMGLDWLRERMTDPTQDFADIYLSAGFSLFFDNSVMDSHLKAGEFSDLTGLEHFNASFDNAHIDLRDPKKQYTIIGVVPAVFMVNTELLGDRPFPTSWKDLLSPAFENTIAMPMQDLDLFNAILLGIYKTYGEEGIERLGKGLHASMHPAQMVKSASRTNHNDAPVITVMPYFFTWMNRLGGTLQPVWPTDGAIISPIFLMTKTATSNRSQPVVDFLCSKEMGNVLSADGKFPSTHPDIDNGLTAEQTFMWPGWDFIYSTDIAALLSHTRHVFEAAAKPTGGEV